MNWGLYCFYGHSFTSPEVKIAICSKGKKGKEKEEKNQQQEGHAIEWFVTLYIVFCPRSHLLLCRLSRQGISKLLPSTRRLFELNQTTQEQ